ncbi:MAG: hypothetical protein WCE63_17030 [Acidobacteriaceae bacterium]
MQGDGNLVRHIRLASPGTLDDPTVLALMEAAATRAKVPFDANGKHRLIIRAIAAKQRPRRSAETASAPSRARTRKVVKS